MCELFYVYCVGADYKLYPVPKPNSNTHWHETVSYKRNVRAYKLELTIREILGWRPEGTAHHADRAFGFDPHLHPNKSPLSVTSGFPSRTQAETPWVWKYTERNTTAEERKATAEVSGGSSSLK